MYACTRALVTVKSTHILSRVSILFHMKISYPRVRTQTVCLNKTASDTEICYIKLCTFSMSRRDIIVDDLLTECVAQCFLVCILVWRFPRPKPINRPRGLTWLLLELIIIWLLQGDNLRFCGVNSSNQDGIAREAKLEVKPKWRPVVSRSEKDGDNGETQMLSFRAKASFVDMSPVEFRTLRHSFLSRFASK